MTDIRLLRGQIRGLLGLETLFAWFVLVGGLPTLSFAWLLLAIGLVGLKSLAILAGITWLLTTGEESDEILRRAEAAMPGATPEAKKKLVLEHLASRVRWAPFGVNDCRLRLAIEKRFLPGQCFTKTLVAFVLQWWRDCFFRYESQAIGAAILLTLIPYSADGKTSSWSEWVALVLAAILVLNAFLMGLEILIGNVMMRSGYSWFFHLGLSYRRSRLNRRRPLREIWNFVRLSVFSLIAVSATCFAYFACRDSFAGILTRPPDGAGLGEPEVRVRLFVEFFAFATTTFATVGYGDVYPTGIGSRLLVAVIHWLAMSYVLFLLQVLLSQKDEANRSE